MARDYASQPRRGRQVRSRNAGIPGWVWLCCGLALGLCAAVAVYIAMRPTADKPAAQLPPPAARPATQSPALPPRQEPRFKFYELLPNFELIPRGDNYQVESEPGKPGRYLIQAGAFKRREDAERRKASIALLGIESRIESVTIDGQGSHFRVRIGPDADFQRVKKTLRTLADNDIESFFIRAGD